MYVTVKHHVGIRPEVIAICGSELNQHMHFPLYAVFNSHPQFVIALGQGGVVFNGLYRPPNYPAFGGKCTLFCYFSAIPTFNLIIR